CCPNAEWRKPHNTDEDGADCETDRPSRNLDIQIADVERVVLDKLPARFDHVAHQNSEHFVGIDSVILVQVHLQKLALLRIHRGLEQLFGIHFAQAFKTVVLQDAEVNLRSNL